MIDGHVPSEMVCMLHAFLEFCYLVQQNIIDEKTLDQIQDALHHFYQYHQIFRDTNMVNTFSLPQQHSMKYYINMIWLYSTPNGLCSSITESKHIKAVKEPYQRSNRNKPLEQMLLTNQQLDKLAATRSDFVTQGMLNSHILVDVAPSNTANQGASTMGKWTQIVHSHHDNITDIHLLQALPGPSISCSQDDPNESYEEDEEGAEAINIGPTAVKAHVRLMQIIHKFAQHRSMCIPHFSTLSHRAQTCMHRASTW